MNNRQATFHRHVFAHKAFIEWIARQEGNNKRRKK